MIFRIGCELLSDFVYSFFEHNPVNTSTIYSIRCELLSDFVYSFFEHNNHRKGDDTAQVVNCFQILYIRSLNTIHSALTTASGLL